jgi:tetratricopeptide (TPR) repeat protein
MLRPMSQPRRACVGWAGAAIALWLGASAWAAPAEKGVRLRPGDDADAKLAEARLVGGRPQLAEEAARACLERKPDSIDCLSVWVRAVSAAGRCGGTEASFARVRAAGKWDAKTALAEGLCLMRVGDMAAAREAFEEAMANREDFAMAQFQLGMVAIREGWFDLVEELRTSLDVLDGTEWMDLVLEGWLAFEQGDPRMDALLAEFAARTIIDGTRTAQAQLAILECERWMELNDPVKAAEVAMLGVVATYHQVRLVACRAEALRRLGDPVEAYHLLDRPWNRGMSGVAREASMVRALVDLGRVDEAEALLATLPDAGDPEVVASQWYVARRKQDAGAMALAERRYALVVGPTRADLSRFVPLVED